MVHGEVCYLRVYNAGVWDSMNWTCAMQGKTKPSLGNERRLELRLVKGSQVEGQQRLCFGRPPNLRATDNSAVGSDLYLVRQLTTRRQVTRNVLVV